MPVISGLTATSTVVNTSELPGGNTANFRLVAHDGVQTGGRDSASFALAYQPPLVQIMQPAEGAIFYYGQLVNLVGDADDLQGRPISLQWHNAAGDLLGTGSLLSLDDLPVGENQLTLRADAVGEFSEAQVTIFVHDDLRRPGARLAVGPTEAPIRVAPESTLPQTFEISISNSGGDQLSWSATESADWLSLSATEGDTPAILTLTADPSGMSGDLIWRTDLTIATSAGGGQSIVVPVSLQMGDYWQAIGQELEQALGQWLFLPQLMNR